MSPRTASHHIWRWAAMLFIFCWIGWPDIEAQCVMCRAVAEDSAEDGGIGAGLNRGILYLMAVPYILLSAFFVVIYLKRKANAAN